MGMEERKEWMRKDERKGGDSKERIREAMTSRGREGREKMKREGEARRWERDKKKVEVGTEREG